MTKYKFNGTMKFKALFKLFSEYFQNTKKFYFFLLLFLLPGALLLTTCVGGSVPPVGVAKYTATVTGTVTTLPPGESSRNGQLSLGERSFGQR